MGCGDECPFYPGKQYLDWALPDPAGKGIDGVRPIRDEIDRRVKALLASLVAVQQQVDFSAGTVASSKDSGADDVASAPHDIAGVSPLTK